MRTALIALFISALACLGCVDMEETSEDRQARRRAGDDSCDYARDGVCDEPTYCEFGTDETDCSSTSSGERDTTTVIGSDDDGDGDGGGDAAGGDGNSCQYANDGVCDEPTFCEYGTDTSDCEGGTAEPGDEGGDDECSTQCWSELLTSCCADQANYDLEVACGVARYECATGARDCAQVAASFGCL